LGEVAHHNLAKYLAQAQRARRSGETKPRVPERSDFLPTNAHSIAQATGIPRQTVRRKVEALVSRGWLIRSENGLIVSPVPFDHFRAFNEEMAKDVLSTLNAVIQLNR
jgi:DNA-binding GntR family transcriptional regulator